MTKIPAFNPNAIYVDAPANTKGNSVTGPQTEVSFVDGQVEHHSPSSSDGAVLDYEKLRRMRRDPTIGLARDIAVAPGMLSSWNVVARDDKVDPKVSAYVEKYVLPLRAEYIRSCLYASTDVGWRAFEVVYDKVEDTELGVIIVPASVKPLKAQTTWVRYDNKGRFNGVIHHDPNGLGWFGIKATHSIFVNFDTEGLGDYGDPLLIRVEEPYDRHIKASEAAAKYDEKLAGAVWLIRYPKGKTVYRGREYDNSEIPGLIYRDMQAGGYMSIPAMLDDVPEREIGNFGEGDWSFELIETRSSSVADFNSRLAYLDRLKVRGLGVLERAVMEGQYGTKADAGEHADVMMMLSSVTYEHVTSTFNRMLLERLLTLNFGEPDLAKLAPAHIGESNLDFMRKLYLSALTSPTVGHEAGTAIDVPALMETLGIPADAKNVGTNTDFSVFAIGAGEVAEDTSANAIEGEGGDNRVSLPVQTP